MMRASGMKSALVNFGCAAEQLVDRGEAGNRHDMGQQRIAVGFGAGGVLRADRARRAGLVLEHDRLLEHGSSAASSGRVMVSLTPPGGNGLIDRDGVRRIGVLRAARAGRARRPMRRCRRRNCGDPCLLLCYAASAVIVESLSARGRSISPPHRRAWRRASQNLAKSARVR